MNERFIVSTNPRWYADHAALLGGQWVKPEDYPKTMQPARREVGALLKPDGSVIHRIKTP